MRTACAAELEQAKGSDIEAMATPVRPQDVAAAQLRPEGAPHGASPPAIVTSDVWGQFSRRIPGMRPCAASTLPLALAYERIAWQEERNLGLGHDHSHGSAPREEVFGQVGQQVAEA